MATSNIPEVEHRRHAVALAVKARPTILRWARDYGDPKLLPDVPLETYHYYKVGVPISMGKVDQMMYMGVYKALENAKHWDPTVDEKVMMITINGPEESWIKPPATMSMSKVRIRVESEAFLKHLYEVCGNYLDIQIEGSLQNSSALCRRKNMVPLRKDGPIELRVKEDGKTAEVSVPIPPGVFEGAYQVESEFTVKLSWFGPEPLFNFFPHCEALRKESKPDLKIIVDEGKKTYKCHSKLLRDHSPVFGAMLVSDMMEQEKKEILIDDFDCAIVEAFLRYIYAGNIVRPYKDCYFCFELLYFAHKYLIQELEIITCEIFQNKPDDWLSTTTALDLYGFASMVSSEHGKILKKRAKSILKCRQDEALKTGKLKKLIEEYPDCWKQLRSEMNWKIDEF